MIIDLSSFYKETGTAKLADIPMYKEKIKEVDVYGQVVTLTGAAPIWLYLTLSCVLQDKVTKLIYNSPVTGDVVVFEEEGLKFRKEFAYLEAHRKKVAFGE